MWSRTDHNPAIRARRARRGQRGFTLIETVAALVILAVAVPPVLIAIADAHHKRANPILATRARWLAEEKLEDIIADRYSPARGYDYLQPVNYPKEDPVADFAGFSRRVILTETDADLQTPGQGYMRVRIEVTWTDAQGEPRTMRIETVLTESSS